MASPQQQDDDSEWDDKSTSEIQSEDSDNLFASRPNRWRGPSQSWRTLTEEDRLTHTALERLRNQDLSLHLYNAFALRNPNALQTADAKAQQSGGPGEEQGEDGGVDIDAETGEPVRHRPWAPPKAWTAWPLRAGLVPPDDFMKRTEDEDEVFTYQCTEGYTPSSNLEEVVSAAILRFAKEKFRARSFEEAHQLRAREVANTDQEPLSSENESIPGETDSDDGEDIDLGGVSSAKSKHKQDQAPRTTFKPVVATDDDISYELIRPSTRSILAKLDQTLAILHHARMTSAQNVLDSRQATSSGDESLYDEATPSRHRSRSRATPRPAGRSASRARSMSTTGAEIPTNADPSAKPKSKRGRKPQSRPREGETEREFLIRRAREQKKKRPAFSDDDDDVGGTTTAAESVKSPVRGRRRPDNGHSEYWTQKKMGRLHLRDWSDVMGAAALAGFSPKIIERATQRCADLFGEGMDMHTISETAALARGAGFETRRYLPGGEISPGEDEGDEVVETRQARSVSRISSVTPSRAVSRAQSRAASPISSGEDPGRERESFSKRQRRSASRGSAVGYHFCPHAGCERAHRGFDRPFNLKRHLRLVHNEEGPAGPKTTEAVEAAESELLGGVHRDGFLEPIRPQKGWRAEDTKKRAKRGTPNKRRRMHGSEKQTPEPGDQGSTEPLSASE